MLASNTLLGPKVQKAAAPAQAANTKDDLDPKAVDQVQYERASCAKTAQHCVDKPKCISSTTKQVCFVKKAKCKLHGKRRKKVCKDVCTARAPSDGTYQRCAEWTTKEVKETGRHCLKHKTEYYNVTGCSYAMTGRGTRELSCDSFQSKEVCAEWTPVGERTIKRRVCVNKKPIVLKKGECVSTSHVCRRSGPRVEVCLKPGEETRDCRDVKSCEKWDNTAKHCYHKCVEYNHLKVVTHHDGSRTVTVKPAAKSAPAQAGKAQQATAAKPKQIPVADQKPTAEQKKEAEKTQVAPAQQNVAPKQVRD